MFCIFVLILLCNSGNYYGLLTVGATVAERDLNYTSREQTALEEFKPKVLPLLKLDYMKTDFYLIRWLRAKDLNIPKAKEMLKQHLKWREENKIDKFDKEKFTDMEAEFPYQINTHDLEGQPVCTVDIYEWDLRRAILQGKTQRLMQYLFHIIENITRGITEEQAHGGNVTRFVVLGNADGFNMAQHACNLCLPVWLQFVRAFEGQYLGFMDEIIVIDAPSTVNIVIDLIKPALSPETQRALKIFGHNSEKWMQYLDTKIARDQRTFMYGGTKEDNFYK